MKVLLKKVSPRYTHMMPVSQSVASNAQTSSCFELLINNLRAKFFCPIWPEKELYVFPNRPQTSGCNFNLQRYDLVKQRQRNSIA